MTSTRSFRPSGRQLASAAAANGSAASGLAASSTGAAGFGVGAAIASAIAHKPRRVPIGPRAPCSKSFDASILKRIAMTCRPSPRACTGKPTSGSLIATRRVTTGGRSRLCGGLGCGCERETSFREDPVGPHPRPAFPPGLCANAPSGDRRERDELTIPDGGLARRMLPMEAEFRVIDNYGGNHAKTQMVTREFARRRGPHSRLCSLYDFGRARRACKHDALAAELAQPQRFPCR